MIYLSGAFYKESLYLCTNTNDGIWKVNITTGEIEYVLSDVYPLHEYEVVVVVVLVCCL